MTPRLLRSHECGPSPARAGWTPPPVGGKASALARLADARWCVPPWFVITAEPGAIGDGLRREIAAALAEIAGDGRTVAVRSSAIAEDGVEASFAGQFESHLDVAHDAVIEHVERVRGSGASDHIRAYRRARGIDDDDVPPAAIVQRMVRAEWAGVAFGADPVTGDRSLATVAVVRGLGDALVGGEAEGDTFVVAGDGVIIRRTLAEPPSGIDDAMVRRVAALVRAVSSDLGSPQDIEWAIEDDTVHLLQARPITGLPPADRRVAVLGALSAPDRRILWDNSNITESYGGIVSPLTFSFARRAYAEVYRAFCRTMAVREDVIAGSDSVFENMLGVLRGRVYYNMLNWYRLLAMLPGYRFNRRFMEQMMGVSESLGAELAERIGADRFDRTGALPGGRLAGRPAGRLEGRLAIWGGVARSGARIVAGHLTLSRRIAAFNRRLDAALSTPIATLKTMPADALVLHYRDLEAQLLRQWDAPIVNDFLAMIFHGVLGATSKAWLDGERTGVHNDLIRDIGGVISTEPAAMLRRMAESIADDEALAARLREAPIEEALAAATAHPALGPLVRTYLDRFADRCLEELKLESPTLEDDPTSLLRSVGHMARRLRDGAPPASDDRQRRLQAETSVRDRLRWRPIRRPLFAWLVRQTRARVRDRENLRFERTRIFGRVRRIFVEIGTRFAEADVLEDRRDIFHLHIDEILGFVEGTAVTTDLRALVALRQREYATWGDAPPDRFETPGSANPLVATLRAKEHVADDPTQRRGIGCCAGIVRGIARVIRDPRGAELRTGEILVAERTDPGWVMLFPAAAGILVERGSLLSHSAIVSRELGIPGVVGVPGVTTWLRDGDEIEFDGSSGVVRLIACAGDGAEKTGAGIE